TAVRSRTRSTMMVANVADTLSRSSLASRYGRSTSPTRAGSRNVAVNPIMVVRNAGPNRTAPSGASNSCHRRARTTYVCTVVITSTTSNRGFAVATARTNWAQSTSFRNHHSSTAVNAAITTPDQGNFFVDVVDDIRERASVL